jgi:hypothetical protein
VEQTDPPTIEALLEVIRGQQVLLDELRAGYAVARSENARLVRMIEGLTHQLDELLRDRHEDQRAERARLRAEAQATVDAA